MKKVLFIFLIILCTITQTKSQKSDTDNNINTYKIDSEQLLLKSKKKNTAAWLLLVGGAGLAVPGIIILANKVTENLVNMFNTTHQPANTKGGEILAYTGTAAMLVSIPLFIGSGNNKRKANLVLKNETVFFNPQITSKKDFVAAGLNINL